MQQNEVIKEIAKDKKEKKKTKKQRENHKKQKNNNENFRKVHLERVKVGTEVLSSAKHERVIKRLFNNI